MGKAIAIIDNDEVVLLPIVSIDHKTRTVEVRPKGWKGTTWYPFSECLGYTDLIWHELQKAWEKMSEKEIHEVNQRHSGENAP